MAIKKPKRKATPQRARRNKRTPATMVEAGGTGMHGSIGVQVATARKNRSQAEVAKATGVSQADVSNLERGKTTMSRATAESIFQEVGIPHSGELADLFE